MLRLFAALLAALQLNAPADPYTARAVLGMKTGITLRMHVVAQDDTDAMQSVKLLVRDGVRDAYTALTGGTSLPMLLHAVQLLPQLTEAAETSAHAAGFDGAVDVSLTIAEFDERSLDGLTIPAGRYPALIIRLGDARGRNWWGLIDQQLALSCASCGSDADNGPVVWDWSAEALAEAIMTLLRAFGL